MAELRNPMGNERGEGTAGPAVLWGVVVALLATAAAALLLALALLIFDRLNPGTSAFLAVGLGSCALGSLYASHRAGRGGLWVGGATGLGYALLAWLLAGLFRAGSLTPLGVLQGLVAATVVGAVAGIVGVNL